MLKRLARGVEFTDDTLALGLIEDIGPGGSFMDSDHTLQYMKKTALFPKIATRDMRDTWIAAGKKDAASRALEIAQSILGRENPAVFPEELDQKIRSRFKGLVAGDAGWK